MLYSSVSYYSICTGANNNMIREAIKQMSAYKPPIEGRSGKGCLLLDFNERTLPVSAKVKQALIDYINGDRLQQYPEYGDFVSRLAAYVGVDETELLITNGSDQGIELVYRLTTEPGDEAIVPVPTFAMLTHSAAVSGLKILQPEYTDDFRYPLTEVLALVSPQTRIITVCNPNNPTGTLLPAADVLRLAASAPHATILVDECYFEYTRETVKDSIKRYPNLFITRTFSKTFGLPALRIGYVLSASANIEELLKVRGPYDVNRLAVIAAQEAIENPAYMEEYVREVLDVSMPMMLDLLRRKNIRFWPTNANFVLFYPPDATRLTCELEKGGILVRPRSGPKIENSVRINVGSQEQTKRAISILEEIL